MKLTNIYLQINGIWELFAEVLPEQLTERNISIGEGASIGERASIGKGASIGEGADFTKVNSIYIIGSKHSVNYYGHGKIKIGCHCRTFDEWLNIYARIGAKEGYTETQIKEYKMYIDLIIAYYTPILKTKED